VWKAKISGFLATQYRHLKLFDQSKKYIEETSETIKKIDDPRLVNQTNGFLMQEKLTMKTNIKITDNPSNILMTLRAILN
jgi:hypothetical protein